jgi:hypothetical protein
MKELEQKLDSEYFLMHELLTKYVHAVDVTEEVTGTKIPETQKQFIVWSLITEERKDYVSN